MLSVLGLLLCLGLCSAQGWDLIWEDNFDFLDYNNWQHEVTMWGGGNGEFQAYTNDPANSFTRDGILHIAPTLTRDMINPMTGEPFGEAYLFDGTMDIIKLYGICTSMLSWGCYRRTGDNTDMLPSVMSARLRSKKRFRFKYGKVEVIAKMPAGDYLWPAIWFLPEYWVYGNWPMSGEVDLMEGRGNRDLTVDGESIGADHVGSTLHWGPAWYENRWFMTSQGKTDADRNFADHFHNYTMVWTQDGFQFIIDGDQLLTVPEPQIPENPGWQGFYEWGKPWCDTTTNPWVNAPDPLMAPFDQEFHFTLNVAVGGTNHYFPDHAVNRVNGEIVPKPWINWEGNPPVDFWTNNHLWLPTWDGEHTHMEVDYIRVYSERNK